MFKKVLVLFLVLVMLAACNPVADAPSAVAEVEVVTEVVEVEAPSVFLEAQNGIPFRWAHDNQTHPVNRIMVAGFLQGCADFGVECEDMSIPGVDASAVIAMEEQSVILGSSGQIKPIYVPEHYRQALDLIDAGIPVIAVHFPVDFENVPGLLAWVAPDNEGYSVEAGKAMAEKTSCGSPIGVTQSSLNDGENLVAAIFRETYLELCPDANVLEVQVEGLDDPAAAILVASSIIQANPDLVGALSTTGAGPTTWAKAAQENGREPGEITIISMDYTRANLDLVKSGEVYMLIGQPLFEEFYVAAGLMAMHNMGLPIPKENVLPAPLITIENVDKYYAINDLAESVGE